MMYLKSALALAFVVGLILLLYAALRHWGDRVVRKRNNRIQVLESVSLGEKRQLFLVRVEDRSFLLAAAGRDVTLLDTLESSPEAGPEKTAKLPNQSLIPRVLNALQMNEGT